MGDYDLLINCNDGNYCLIFLNQHSLEKREITEIFSQFGHIYNLRYHKNETGYWFVRYKSINEAKHAVEGLQNHPTIRLSEHHKKKQAQANHHFSDKSPKNDHGQQASDGHKFTHQFNRQNNKKIDKPTFNRNENYKENECHGNFNNDVPSGPKSPNRNQKQNNMFQRPNNCQGNSDGVPDLIDQNRKRTMEKENEDDIPELVTSSGKNLKATNPMKKVLHAQEVIVANIHPKFGAPYILHLFDRFTPLAISNIMVEPKTAKRYCHVYFKSAQDSEQVESLFDRTPLLDQKLVVIRSSQLV